MTPVLGDPLRKSLRLLTLALCCSHNLPYVASPWYLLWILSQVGKGHLIWESPSLQPRKVAHLASLPLGPCGNAGDRDPTCGL